MDFNLHIDIKLLIFALLILGYFIFQGFQLYKRFTRKKFWLWFSLRFITLICLLLVIFQLEVVLTSRETTTIFLVDCSLSVDESKTRVEEYINKQIAEKKAVDKFAVITFGKEPMVEIPFAEDINTVRLETRPDVNFTNLEEALTFSIDYFPEKTNKRLVLCTDGKENMGEALNVIQRIKENKINMVICTLPTKQDKDVEISSLHIPTNLYKNETVPLELTLNSNLVSDGTFYLFCENEKVLEEKLTVKKGENTYKYSIPLNAKGNVTFKGEIAFQADTNLNNNVFATTLAIKDNPKALVIGDKVDTQNIDELLDSLEIKRVNYASKQVPDSIDFLANFSEIFLVNVAHKDLTSKFENNLAACVQEQGIGLIVIGGEKTFALGGYEETQLEEILPVGCRMKGTKKQPNTGIILVLDCSGSMNEESNGVKKIEMVKEAAIRSVEILELEDYVGVLAFSDRMEWIVPFQQAKDKEKIKYAVGRLSPKGGTLILPALDYSADVLTKADAKVKHIILLTDGQGEKSGYDALVQLFKESKITVSTVAVGKDADKSLLSYLSENTGGRSYFVEDFYSVPEIFARETYLATKKYLNNREFIPEIVNKTEFMKTNSLPKLKGYIGTGIKEKATMILKSDMDDPILAAWQYGLGKVLVWTSDLNSIWSSQWLNWEDFQEQWGLLVNSCLPQFEKDMNVQVTQRGCNVEVYVDSLERESGLMLQMIIQGPESKSKINLEQVMVGKFKGNFNLERIGDYVLTCNLLKNDNVIKKKTRIIHLNYSPEYTLDSNDSLESLQLGTNSYFANNNMKIFELPNNIKNKSYRNLDFILLSLALCCFIADIGVRKW